MGCGSNKVRLNDQAVNQEALIKVYSTYKQIRKPEGQKEELNDTICRVEREPSINKPNPSYNNGSMQVILATLTGVKIFIDVEPNITVEMLKARIEEKRGTAPRAQRLIYGGKQLEDKRTLADYNIQHGNTLHLTLRLLG